MSRNYWSTRDRGLEPAPFKPGQPAELVPVELSDKDPMTFGMHEGKCLGDVPMKYWSYLLEQPGFASQRPQHARYARRRLNLDDDNKPKART